MSLLDILDQHCLECIMYVAQGPFKTRMRAICARMRDIVGLWDEFPPKKQTADDCLTCGAAIGCTHLCKLARDNGATKFAYALTAAVSHGQRATCDLMREWCSEPTEDAVLRRERVINPIDLMFDAAMFHQGAICEHILGWKESRMMVPILCDRMLHCAAGVGDRTICMRARVLAKERGFELNYAAMLFNAILCVHIDICILAHDWMVEEGRVDLLGMEYLAEKTGDAQFLATFRSWLKTPTERQWHAI